MASCRLLGTDHTVLAAVLYFAVYLSSTGPVRTTFPTEPTTTPRPLHTRRNLLLGIVAFICVDGAIFHTGLYVSILAPSSYAGRIARITRSEKERAPSRLKEVLVLGDSRIAEGFSTTLANELGSPAGIKFVSLAEPAASANTWYYMVRETDPTSRRYSAIVIPYGIGYEPNSADPLRISMTAPLLRYGDCFHFAFGFNDGLAGSGPLSPAYCEAQHIRTTLLIFSNIPSRDCEASDKRARECILAPCIKAGITILWAQRMMRPQGGSCSRQS